MCCWEAWPTGTWGYTPEAGRACSVTWITSLPPLEGLSGATGRVGSLPPACSLLLATESTPLESDRDLHLDFTVFCLVVDNFAFCVAAVTETVFFLCWALVLDLNPELDGKTRVLKCYNLCRLLAGCSAALPWLRGPLGLAVASVCVVIVAMLT